MMSFLRNLMGLVGIWFCLDTILGAMPFTSWEPTEGLTKAIPILMPFVLYRIEHIQGLFAPVYRHLIIRNLNALFVLPVIAFYSVGDVYSLYVYLIVHVFYCTEVTFKKVGWVWPITCVIVGTLLVAINYFLYGPHVPVLGGLVEWKDIIMVLLLCWTWFGSFDLHKTDIETSLLALILVALIIPLTNTPQISLASAGVLFTLCSYRYQQTQRMKHAPRK